MAESRPLARRLLVAVPLLTVFATVLVGGHLYLLDRLVDAPGWPPEWTKAGRWAVGLLGATLVLQPFGERLLRRPWSLAIAWPASVWMGVAFLLLVLLGASELGVWVVGAATAAPAEAAPGAVPLDRWRAAWVLLLGAGLGAWALRGGLAGPRLVRRRIELRDWPEALSGLRIVQISDIHVGPILGRRFAREVTERVNALEPDLVAVTGDLVDGRLDLLRDEVAPFRDLRGRLGVYFVTGNHDHYSGARAWAEHAGELGMTVLRNEHLLLCDRGAEFVLAGVDDHRGGMMPGDDGGEDLDAALSDAPPGRAIVLLAHDPGTFKAASTRGIGVQLSGHTHGGQIWPFEYLVRLAVPWVAGLHRRGDAQLYVSRGTGFWGPPMRLGAPAEITEITLVSAGAH